MKTSTNIAEAPFFILIKVQIVLLRQSNYLLMMLILSLNVVPSILLKCSNSNITELIRKVEYMCIVLR